MTELLIINDNDINTKEKLKININETNDKTTLKLLHHYLNINFSPVPFIWHYDDFAQPYPLYGIKKINYHHLKKYWGNKNLWFATKDLNDNNTDIYISIQYKMENYMYNPTTKPSELFLSYHSWLYTNAVNNYEITENDISQPYKFRYLTGIIPLEGTFEYSATYPFLLTPKMKKIPGGIPINESKLEMRQSTIHKHQNNLVFSPNNVCNFNLTSENGVFISVMKLPCILVKENKENKENKEKQQYQLNKFNIKTPNNKTNCVVIHIFRNVYDNNPNNNEFQELINKYT